MIRHIYIVGIVTLVILGIVLVINLAKNPMNAHRAWLEKSLANPDAGEVDLNIRPDLDLDKLEKAINNKTSLWSPLVPLPPSRPTPPDLKQMVGQVEVTRNRRGSGESLKLKIKLSPTDTNPQWYGVGDTINNVTIKQITDKEVIFSFFFDAEKKEYTYTVPRP